MGCCAASLAAIAVVPPDDILALLTPEQAAEAGPRLRQARTTAAYEAAALALLAVLPALIQLVLAFHVRRGARRAVQAAMVLLVLQALPVALLTIGSLAAIIGGQADAMLSLAVAGGLLVLLGITLRALWVAFHTPLTPASVSEAPSAEPWDDLPR